MSNSVVSYHASFFCVFFNKDKIYKYVIVCMVCIVAFVSFFKKKNFGIYFAAALRFETFFDSFDIGKRIKAYLVREWNFKFKNRNAHLMMMLVMEMDKEFGMQSETDVSKIDLGSHSIQNTIWKNCAHIIESK